MDNKACISSMEINVVVGINDLIDLLRNWVLHHHHHHHHSSYFARTRKYDCSGVTLLVARLLQIELKL